MDNEPFYLEKRRCLRCLSLSRKEAIEKVPVLRSTGKICGDSVHRKGRD